MGIKVVTNGQWRDFVYRSDVPEKVLKSQFDWTDKAHEDHGDYSDGFLCYRGVWYHVADFQRGGIEGWSGSHGDSFFSGVVIRLSKDGEQYQIGTYYQVSEEQA